MYDGVTLPNLRICNPREFFDFLPLIHSRHGQTGPALNHINR